MRGGVGVGGPGVSWTFKKKKPPPPLHALIAVLRRRGLGRKSEERRFGLLTRVFSKCCLLEALFQDLLPYL